MTTTDTDTTAETEAFALLSEADAAALEAAYDGRLAAIAADVAAMIDASIVEHFAERDRLETAAHEALLAQLAARTETLAQMEAAAATVATPAAVATKADKAAPPKETTMSDAQPAEATAVNPTPVATVAKTEPAAPAAQPMPGVAEHTAVHLPAGFAAVAAERRRLAETEWLARTAGRRADHAAALEALAVVEARIVELAAASGDDTGTSRRTARRRDRIAPARSPASAQATGPAPSA